MISCEILNNLFEIVKRIRLIADEEYLAIYIYVYIHIYIYISFSMPVYVQSSKKRCIFVTA